MKQAGYLPNLFVKTNNLIQRSNLFKKLRVIMFYIDGFILFFIKKPKKQENIKKKVLIIYNLVLGDGIIFSCSMKNIRKIFPSEKFELSIACQKGLDQLYEKLNVFDEVIPLNFTKSILNLKERYILFRKLRDIYYDIIIDPIGIEECTMNVLLTRATVGNKKISVIDTNKKGKKTKRHYKVYNQIIEIDGNNMSLIEYYYQFFNKISNKNYPVEYIDLPYKDIDKRLPKEYFIVYPSASTTLKKWPVERFAEVSQKAYNKTRIPMLLCGTMLDKEVNDKLKELLPEVEIIDYTGKTNILEFIGLIKKSKFVLTNDTGIYHISVVSNVPVAIVAGGYTYDRYLAYNFKNNIYKKPYIIAEKQECFNCEHRCKYYKEIKDMWPCLEKITADMAWKIIEEMIDNELLL